jgi:hypothetical protein
MILDDLTVIWMDKVLDEKRPFNELLEGVENWFFLGENLNEEEYYIFLKLLRHRINTELGIIFYHTELNRSLR